MKIALLCPTRNRLNDVQRLIKSIENTTDCNSIILYLGVDSGDNTYNELHVKSWIIKVPSGCGEEFIGLGKIWNNMMTYVIDDILMMCGDDMVFETKDWDKMILKEFENDKIKMVHCNDGMRGEGNPYHTMTPLAVASFIHRIYYDTFGYYVREEWKHGFHDSWIDDVYNRMGKKTYRHDIMIRHLHFSNPTAGVSADKISERLGAGYRNIADPQALFDSMANIRQKEADILCQKQ